MFTLHNHFLAIAEQKAYDDVNRRLASKAMNFFQEELSTWSEGEVIRYVINKRGVCFQLGIYTEKGILGFVFIGLLLGEEFCNIHMVEALQNKNNGDEMIDAFFKLLTTSL